MFIGYLGTKNADNYKKAQQLLADGVAPILVRHETGFFKGLDSELREEISDKNSRIKNINLNKLFGGQYESGDLDAVWYKRRSEDEYSITINRFEPNSNGSYFEYLGIFTKDDLINTFNLGLVKSIVEDLGIDSKKGSLIRDSKMKIITPDAMTMGDVFEHEGLFACYPELSKIPVFPSQSGSSKASVSVSGDGAKLIKLSIDLKNDLALARKAILHELQHVVQRIEGWSIGSNSKMFEPVDRTLYDITQLQIRLNKMLVDEQSGSAFSNFLKAARDLSSRYPNSHKNSFDADEIPEHELDRFVLIQDSLDAINPQILELHDRIGDLVKQGSGIVSAFEQYEHSAGEIEARTVMEHSEMSDDELSKSVPYTKTDYDNASIFRTSYDQFCVNDGYRERKVGMGASRDGQFMELFFSKDSIGVDAMYASSYVFLRAYSQLANEGASPIIKDDYQAILDWDRDFNDGKGSMSMSLAKAFAKAFESYILYAAAPPQIENQLGTFKEWIQATVLKLDPKLADKGAYEALYPVFDRMLGSASEAALNPVMAEVMATQIMESTDAINHELAHSTGVVFDAFYQSLEKRTGIPADSIKERFSVSIRGEKADVDPEKQTKRRFGLPPR
ncbi:hypothetical protein OTK49_03410 [Vibrio coralliirubri]|uniref:LPD23 domain-containing protein n=1 Tax=Vibrio coralliirubri TaxID=1516159 RepID=UPI0022840660|nr:LPD23 domain-containing protein [Vibrio coralliirubri]MCY9861565.1 hypothetical protein [Vibrio coralliirubri]